MTNGPKPAFKRPWLAVALVVIIGAVAFLRRPAAGPDEITIGGLTMGTTFSVKVVVGSGDYPASERKKLADAIQVRLDRVNVCMSTYQDDSELSRFNRHPAGVPFEASPSLFHVFQRAREVSELTSGAFDVTVGPLVNAYGFGPESRPISLPASEQLAELRRRIGYRFIQLDDQAHTLTKKKTGLYADLSAIAKGYGVDEVARLLEETGFAHYMVEVGGEVRVRGLNVYGKPWRIAVEKPVKDGRALHTVVELSDLALATSGDYRNYYTVDGVDVSHTIDPRTGAPVTHDLASVTVLAPTCEWADAWATALMVLGPEEGYNLADRQGLAALFLIRGEQEAVTEKATSAFDRATGRAGDALGLQPVTESPTQPGND